LSGFHAQLRGSSSFSQEMLLALPLLHPNSWSLVQPSG